MTNLINKDTSDYIIVGEIVRLIDLLDDEKKLSIIFKYAEVAFNMKTVVELAEKFNSEDKDSSYEEFKNMTKEFIERL